MVGVCVGLEHAHDPDAVFRRLLEVVIDLVDGIDDDCNPGILVADQVGRAAQVVIDELAKQHPLSLTLDSYGA